MAEFKEWVRRWLPGPAWVFLRRSRSYLRRLRRWATVLARVRGEGPGEALKLYLSALAAPVTELSDLDEWGHPAVLFDMRVRTAHGGRFLCRRSTADLGVVQAGTGGGVWRAIAGNLEPGGVFVDAGANVGGLTVPGARRVGPEGQVIAIEMMPETAAHLRHNLGLNGLDWVRVVEGALSDAEGREVTAAMPAGYHGRASLVPEGPAAGGTIEVRVRTLTLDGVLADLPRIDVLKLDLEGAELPALEGGRASLGRTRCVIFEDWGGQGPGREVADRIAAAGFRLRRVDGINMIGTR